MARIWRLENSDGVGVYSVTYPHTDAFPCGREHPGPRDDYKLHNAWEKLSDSGDARYWRFGFSSLKQFKEWFHSNEMLENLRDRYDIRLSCYEVARANLKVGDRQCIYVDGTETFVERVCPLSV